MAQKKAAPRTKKVEIALPRIEYLRVENYRALKSIVLDGITPLTVLLGPNGSGKSTVFDVFSFMAECFQFGLRHAWDRRGRARELKTRGQTGPISIELKYREGPNEPLITYHLAVDEEAGKVFVAEEWLSWRRGRKVGYPFKFLDYKRGEGFAISGEAMSLLLPRMLGATSFCVYPYQCKTEMLAQLPVRLKGYAKWLPPKTRHPRTPWSVVNRIVVQELEAWYFGDWAAVRAAYPRVPATIPMQARFRDPDAIRTTWERFEGVLKEAGYFKGGLRKLEAARAIAPHLDPARNTSRSFQALRSTLSEMMSP